MNEILAQHGDVIQIVAVTLICVNVALSALQKILGLIMDKTKTKADNKAYVVVTSVMAFLASAVDWASANRAHDKK
jgi:predicted transcriptional regulator YheO